MHAFKSLVSVRITAFVLTVLAGSSFAQKAGLLEGKKIAVLEFSVGAGVKLQARELLADECRGALADLASPEGALVVTRQNMLEVLKATGGKCVEGECEVETARNLGVDLFVTGTVTQIDGELLLSLMTYETRKAQLLGQKRVSATREKALMELVRPATEELARKAFRIAAPRPVSAPPPSPVELGVGRESNKELAAGGNGPVLARFESEPEGAAVKLDGQSLCVTTPCSRLIAQGRHEVVFELERHAAARLTTVVSTGAVVRASLQPDFGWLTITTDVPGVGVAVEGRTVGTTPVIARETTAGPVDVDIDDRCFSPTGEKITLKNGERRTIHLRASPRLAGLRVDAVDTRGRVLVTKVQVDGRDAGETGQSLNVPLCSTEVAVQLGDREWKQVLKLQEKAVTVITLTAPPGTSVDPLPAPVKGMAVVRGGQRVKPFLLDVTEVTVAAYAECVATGECTPPGTGKYCNWEVTGREQHPVNCVDWSQADAYCQAQDKRLPESSEWAHAASNGGKTKFPWGNTFPGLRRARWSSTVGTSRVGGYPAGANETGILDLAGNVYEWMANDYGAGKEVRGGSWNIVAPAYLGVSSRVSFPVSARDGVIGFRCAR
ncbi:MAG: hypothetical protein RL653_559 [Pseudomonadota bacterium]|jgi:hypothetical protein